MDMFFQFSKCFWHWWNVYTLLENPSKESNGARLGDLYFGTLVAHEQGMPHFQVEVGRDSISLQSQPLRNSLQHLLSNISKQISPVMVISAKKNSPQTFPANE
jgi:hypothetical protein